MQRILLIDRDDPRRRSRVMLLVEAGYEVEVRADRAIAKGLDGEAGFDLVILALHHGMLEDAVAYSERLAKQTPVSPFCCSPTMGSLRQAGVAACRQAIPSAWCAGLQKCWRRALISANLTSTNRLKGLSGSYLPRRGTHRKRI